MSVILILFLIYTPPNLWPKDTKGITWYHLAALPVTRLVLHFLFKSGIFLAAERGWYMLTWLTWTLQNYALAHSRPEIHRTVGNKIRMYKSSTTSSLLSFSVWLGVPKKKVKDPCHLEAPSSGISDTFFLGKSWWKLLSSISTVSQKWLDGIENLEDTHVFLAILLWINDITVTVMTRALRLQEILAVNPSIQISTKIHAELEDICQTANHHKST